MTYSAKEQEEIDRIRKKYVPAEENKMATLRALDASAEKKATVRALIVGVIGTLILGIGMSLAMTDIAKIFGSLGFFAGILIGVIGIITLALAYPLYNRTLKRERARIAPEILRLTDELMK